MHAGTPIHQDGGEHSFEEPDTCGACSEDELVPIDHWTRYHE
jgi:hypothetical protein